MVIGGFTVRAVVFTVVIGCPGVCHYQQLLDVTLEEKKKSSMSAEAMSTNFTGELRTGKYFPHYKFPSEFSFILDVPQH